MSNITLEDTTELTHLGLDQENTVINLKGELSKKLLTYLDSTASALPDLKIMNEMREIYKKIYANTHTIGHHRGREATNAVNAARHAVGTWVGYDQEKDFVTFNGSGATGPLNYLAQTLFPKELQYFNDKRIPDEIRKNLLEKLSPQERTVAERMRTQPVVITTAMEHHSNQLPWSNAGKVEITPVDEKTGLIDIDKLESLLKHYNGEVRLVTVSGASNITGIMNPIYEIAKLAHKYGAEICVDAAQLAPHRKIEKRRSEESRLDYLIGAMHKAGVPGTPGVLIANQSLLKDRQHFAAGTGGGMVNTVQAPVNTDEASKASVFGDKSKGEFEFTLANDLASGEEPGTPNISGIIAVGLAAAKLTKTMDKLMEHEKELTHSLMRKLKRLEAEGIKIVGDADPEKRVGVVSIEIEGVPHPVVTAFLNDHWNIAVRNGCFCAQPYVSTMLGAKTASEYIQQMQQGDRSKLPGYTRISFGEHNTEKDVRTVIEALTELIENKEKVNSLYTVGKDGNATRTNNDFRQEPSWIFEEGVKRITMTGDAAKEPSKNAAKPSKPTASQEIRDMMAMVTANGLTGENLPLLLSLSQNLNSIEQREAAQAKLALVSAEQLATYREAQKIQVAA